MGIGNNLQHYLGLGSRRAFGVDFNNEAIKILQLEKKGKISKVSGFNKKKIARDVMDNYEIRDEGKFQEIFLSAVEEAEGKMKGKEIIVSLPENKVFTRIITMPAMDPAEAGEAVKWETESNIPISIDEVYFDWQIVGKTGSNMKVLVMACPRKLIDNYLSAFSGIGYQVSAFEAESIATGRCVLDENERKPTLIVDLGSDSTSFSIYQEGIPVFTSSGSVSGKMITDTISKKLNLDEEKSESYKIKVGLGENKFEREEAFSALNPLLSSLVTELQRTMGFYHDKMIAEKGEGIAKIVLCGGGSNLKGLVSFLGVNLQSEIILSNPWANVNLGKNMPPISKEVSQGFATVIGLAIRGQEHENFN